MIKNIVGGSKEMLNKLNKETEGFTFKPQEIVAIRFKDGREVIFSDIAILVSAKEIISIAYNAKEYKVKMVDGFISVKRLADG